MKILEIQEKSKFVSYVWNLVGFLVLLLLCQKVIEFVLSLWYISSNFLVKEHVNFFNVSNAYIITMKKNESFALLENARFFFKTDHVWLFDAINGSRALHEGSKFLSIYTKYTLMTGRHDHMQISNSNALGCLLSHINIWQMIKPNDIVAVVEEDGYFDEFSISRLEQLHEDMRNLQWDVLMLDSGQFISTGSWEYIGKSAVTCANQWWKNHSNAIFQTKEYERVKNKIFNKRFEYNESFTDDSFLFEPTYNLCSWFGTRGYLITFNGAQKLLKHAYPIQVQVDALMGLVDAFESDFKMFWTRQNIVHQKMLYFTQIWDACVKCYLPSGTVFYIIVFIFILTCIACNFHHSKYASSSNS